MATFSSNPKSKSARTNKAKGRKFQGDVRDKILETYPELQRDDVRSTASGQNGEDIQLSPAARHLFPFSVECKRYKTFAIYTAYEQAQVNAGLNTPLLVIRGDNKKALAVLDFNYFMEMSRYARMAKKFLEEDKTIGT